jgi:DNA-binding FadR family transcriptional regulator
MFEAGDTRRRRSDGTAERIIQLITSGPLEVGDKLPGERELARSLGVSRSLVRESLRTLESFGLIDVRHGVGAIVTSTSMPAAMTAADTRAAKSSSDERDTKEVLSYLERTTILDVLEAREILEVVIVKLASERITEEESEWLRQAARRKDSWNANREFHITLASITHNFMLERLITMMLDLLADAHQREHYASPDTAQALLEQHVAIADAVIARDAELAQQLMREHFRQTRQTIVWKKR